MMDGIKADSTQSNKEIAVAFQKLVTSGKVQEAYDKYVSPSFRHHNPYFPGDAASLKAGMEENARQFPDKLFEIQRVLADGDLVAVHSRLRLKPEMPDVAVVHIFRFAHNLIVEEWDVGQPVPAESPNENGVF